MVSQSLETQLALYISEYAPLVARNRNLLFSRGKIGALKRQRQLIVAGLQCFLDLVADASQLILVATFGNSLVQFQHRLNK